MPEDTNVRISEQTDGVAKDRPLTISELANEIGYSKIWIHRLVKSGRISASKPTGGHWRIPASEVRKIKEVGLPPRARKIETEQEKPNEVTVSGDHARRTSFGGQRAKEEEEIRIRTVSDLFGLFRRKGEE